MIACLAAALPCLLAGCGGSSPGGPVDDDVRFAQAWVGPSGGLVVSGAVRVVIPPDALSSAVQITVSAVDAPPPGRTAAGPAVDLGPSGQELDKAVSVTVPYSVVAADSVQLFAYDETLDGWVCLGGELPAKTSKTLGFRCADGGFGADTTDVSVQ